MMSNNANEGMKPIEYYVDNFFSDKFFVELSSEKQGGSDLFGKKITIKKEDVECLRRELKEFCKTGKKEDAFTVYFCFCEIFKVFGDGYKSMQKLLEFLSDHEYHSGELLKKHRDHYSHSAYVFALGLAIYANYNTYKKAIMEFYNKEAQFDNEEQFDVKFLYLWGLSALFHDIGYPFELAHEQIHTYVNELYGSTEMNKPYVSYSNMKGDNDNYILALNDKVRGEAKKIFNNKEGDNFNANDLLARGIEKRLGLDFDILLEMFNNRYQNRETFMDHAYFSSVLLIRQLVVSDVKFTMPIVDVLTAIAFHNNLKRDLSEKKRLNTQVARDKHPLAFLLILCDELQNWDRTAFGTISKKDPLAYRANFEITDDKIKVTYVFDSFEVVEYKQDEKKEWQKNPRSNQNYIKTIGGVIDEEEENSLAENIGTLLCLEDNEIEILPYERKKEKRQKAFASSDKFINLCDFAKAIHNSYNGYMKAMGKETDEFEDLSLEYKVTNLNQAKSYADKLELINCFYSDKELDYPIVNEFTAAKDDNAQKDDLGFLAREEHLRWVKEKYAAGWTYGKNKDAKKKTHPDLIPYDALSKEERDKDELMVKNMIPLLYTYGHGVRIYSYRMGRKDVSHIAAVGHEKIDYGGSKENKERIKNQIKDRLRDFLKEERRVIVVSDFKGEAARLIVECALELNITVKAVLDREYEDYVTAIEENNKLTKTEKDKIRKLLAHAVSCKVEKGEDGGTGLSKSNAYIINKCNKMIALWNGVEVKLKDENGKCINNNCTWHIMSSAKNLRRMEENDICIITCQKQI